MTGRIVNVRPKPGFLMDGAGEIVPARTNVVSLYARDKLSNVMSGKGTAVDRSIYNQYQFLAVEPAQAEAAYRTSWLMRKIVDIPPLDMTRAWRQWQAEDTDIEEIEAEERRLQLREKVKRALILARLWGGGAIVLGVAGDEPEEELRPDRVKKGGLAWAHVFSRYQLTAASEITDPESPWFGHPEYFHLTTTSVQGRMLKVHPSRVIAFVGQKAPEGSLIAAADWFWGDPLFQSIKQAIENADLAQDGFAALIDEAKLDIIKIPDMMANIGTEEYETKLLTRLSAATRGKSTWRALLLDGAEEWEQRETTWTGMPDIITSYLQIVAGAADIPITRLLGQSPKGLQSTGEGEERDYHAMIAARQDELLAPALDRIDEVMIRSALGSKPDDIWYSFNPLDKLSAKDAAEIESKYATAVKTYADTGLWPDTALADIAKNRLSESGNWPGSEKAFEDAEAAGEEPPGDDDDLLTAEERGAGQAANDAAPRTLYVRRNLVNADEFIRWAKSQGFETTTPAEELHVTVLYSRTPVDWMKMGHDWHGDDKGHLIVPAGGARLVEPLGDKGAVVLLFGSSALSWRHEEMVRNGASHDFDGYQPHVTITYARPEGLDVSAVEPFRGALRFGPEIFEELDEDWANKLTEA